MDETGKEYILQWSGHAASVTERFSGLLARQALVDVTLICQEQKLRVHKLVLASCSLYFEEMLEQDLGQEPIILLKDLDFDILKAMVEFMYCGETTIAHCHLQSLLDAAEVFKVKDLESIVDVIMKSKNYMDNDKLTMDNKDFSTNLSSKNCVQVKLNGKDDDDGNDDGDNDKTTLTLTSTSNNSDQLVENNTLEDVNNTEDMYDNDSTKAFTTIDEKIAGNTLKFTEIIEQSTTDDTKAIFDDDYYHESSPLECNSMDLCENSIENGKIEYQKDTFDLLSGVGECSRVYTHKKRKSVDEKKPILMNKLITESIITTTTDCIDLSDDLSCDTTPVTLPSALNMEITDYIWNSSAETIQGVMGGTMYHGNSLYDRQYDIESYEKSSLKGLQLKELFSINNHNISRVRTPVLRRSVRLNQLENEDTVNNNSDTTSKPRERHKEQFKSKQRKNRDCDARISDENSSVTTKKNLNNSRSSRSAAKFTPKTSGSSSKSLNSRLTKDEKNSKTRKLKNVKFEKIESLESDIIYVPQKLNTIATVDRALWGDMSDVLENYESGQSTEFPEYSLSKEIPFAVGLLPLHAALERMQAMPDYQPRKTRSSFAAPIKQDCNGIKRKGNNIYDHDTGIFAKKPCSPDRITRDNDDNDDDSSTVCHIQIHTSSQCSDNRRNVNDQLVSVNDSTDDKR